MKKKEAAEMNSLPQETIERIEKEAKAYAIVQKNGYINGAQVEALKMKRYLEKIIEVIDTANLYQQQAALKAIKALCQEGLSN